MAKGIKLGATATMQGFATMRRLHVSCAALLLLLVGCIPLAQERNAFWTMTETYGVTAGTGDEGGTGTGVAAEAEFRLPIALSFVNNHDSANVETSFAAWVNLSSIHSAEQQDALLRGGYVQLSQEVQLGSVFTLVPGTFVYSGTGFAGATPVTLGCPLTATTEGATANDFELITPDVLLVFSQPPVSCDSVAFVFRGAISGAATGPSTGEGGFKTYAQVDVYECEPLSPGLFLRNGGGATQANEFFEGDTILFEFNQTADADGNFANVTISG
jgi:hypothetical protein